MVLLRQMLFNLVIAAIAEAILMQISSAIISQGCSRYLKVVTSFNFRQVMLISALTLFVLLVMILLFYAQASVLYAIALSTSLLVRS